MSWRQLPALTLVLLGLLLAAPLSSGDKGLWLSVAHTAALLTDAPAGGLPAEHSTVLPDRQARPAVTGRTEAGGTAKSLGTSTDAASLGLGDRWTPTQDTPETALLQPVAALAAPRAPPA